MDYKNLLIEGTATVLDAMKQLDQVAKKVLYLVENEVLIGALSDGDIRRWILTGGDLHAPITGIFNRNPKFLPVGESESVKDFLQENGIESVPLVDEQGHIVKVVFWNEKKPVRQKEKLCLPVVMMAGVKGTRLYPYTKVLPKPLIPIGESPIAEIIMDRFYTMGCEAFYLVVNHKKNMIKAYFGEVDKPYTVEYADEIQMLGTGGGIRLLKGRINETFILTNCDILVEADFSEIYSLHKRDGNAVTMICSLKNFSIPYGVVDIGEHGEVAAMKEKPQISFFTNTGSYIVEPCVIDLIADNENIGFPDVIARCQEKGLKTGVYPINEGKWMDMGQLDEMEKMCLRLNEEHK